MNRYKIGAGCLLAFALFSCAKRYPNDPMGENGHTQRTENLLANMAQQADTAGYMFGHQDATVYGIGWGGDSARSDVKAVCNDFPAVVGFDLGHLELGDSLNLDGVPLSRMRQAIIEHFDRGGVVTLSWHCDNPLTGGTAWVKPDSLTSVQRQTVAAVLDGGSQHEKFLGWLDRVADFLKSLETPYGVRVPVIFRPWHEHTGSWFWWGKDLCTKEQYAALWQMTVDRLRKRDVANVLYAYSPGAGPAADEQAYLERYPGDELVDLLGLDIYCSAAEGDTTALAAFSRQLDAHLAMMRQVSKARQKPMAVTETGYMGIPMDDWWTQTLAPVLDKYPVAYVLVWRNAHNQPGHYFAPYPGQRSVKDFVAFYNDKRSLFLHDVNAIYLEKKKSGR